MTTADPVSAPDAERGADPQPRRWGMFAVVGGSLLLFSLDQTSVATALTSIGHDLGTDIAWTGWIITIYSLGQILTLPLGRWLSARYGSRLVFLVSIAAFTIMLAACAFAASLEQLIAFRFVQGLVFGGLMPAGSGIVAHAFGRDRDRALALFTSVFPTGAIIGPLLGGLVLTFTSWRGIFLLGLPIGVLLFVVGALLVRDPPRRDPERVDLLGIVLISVALLTGMVAVALLGSGGSGWTGPYMVTGALVVAAVAGVLFVRHARRHPKPVVPLHLLAGRGLGVLNLTNVVIGAAAIGFSATVPLYAQSRYALLPLAAGVLLTARAITMVVASATTVALLRRVGHKPLLMTGMVATVVSLVATAVPPPGGLAPGVWLAIAAAVMGLGMGLTATAANNAGMHLVPDEVSAMSGLRVLFRQFGAILAISVTTAVSAASATPGIAMAWAFVVLAALMTGATALIARIPNQRGRW